MHACGNSTCECGIFSMDSKTPLKVHLSAYYKRSFAFHTIKERMPIILTKLIDSLVREKNVIVKEFGTESKEELKSVIGEISKLKYLIQTNKPIPYFDSDQQDLKIYDQYLLEQSQNDGKTRFFTAIWLHAECFMYRRIKYFFENTTKLKDFDYFKKQKQEAFAQSLGSIISLGEYLLLKLKNVDDVDPKEEFAKLVKLNLWGNRCDLSISAGEDNAQSGNPLETIEKYENYILCNHIDKIWQQVQREKYDDTDRIIDFINDNAGYEIFTDFCLADFLITFKYCEKICFNLKSMPWFISDTTPKDFRWIIRTLINHENPTLKKLGIRWNKYIRENVWIYKSDTFWTLPFDFTKMESQDPELYERLSQSKLLIFKGDLNYRKLFGEINWEPTTDVNEALQNFKPGKLGIFRTVKADIICGLQKGIAEELDKKDPLWMTTGDYGVIQYAQ